MTDFLSDEPLFSFPSIMAFEKTPGPKEIIAMSQMETMYTESFDSEVPEWVIIPTIDVVLFIKRRSKKYIGLKGAIANAITWLEGYL